MEYKDRNLICRMAGNIMASLIMDQDIRDEVAVEAAVAYARDIVECVDNMIDATTVYDMPPGVGSSIQKICQRCRSTRDVLSGGRCAECVAYLEACSAVAPSPLASVHGRDGLSRDAVADAIYAQAEGKSMPPGSASMSLMDIARAHSKANPERVTETLELPWRKAQGVYDSDGPGHETVELFMAGAHILVEPTNIIAPSTMRTRYRVYCHTCEFECHRATTGTTSHVVGHLKEKHGFAGEVKHQEQE